MASRMLHRATAPAHTFWRFPSRQYAAKYQNADSRAFSSTPRREVTVLDCLTAPPLFLLTSIHAAYIPWWAAIPTTAILVRGVLGYYIVSKEAHRRRKLTPALIPLIAATASSRFRAKDYAERMKRGALDRLDFTREKKSIADQMSSFTRSPRLLLGWFLNFGVLISTTEAVRMKIGANAGLLSFMVSIWRDYIWQPLTKNAAADINAARKAIAIQSADSTPHQITSVDELVSSLTQPTTESGLPLGTELSSYDPTVALEGLSFCQDLTAQDSTGILSTALLIVMLSNVALRPRSRAGLPQLTSFDYIYMFLAGLLWTLADLPAGIYIYLIASTAVAKVVSVYLDVVDMPPSPIEPCTRSTRRITLRI